MIWRSTEKLYKGMFCAVTFCGFLFLHNEVVADIYRYVDAKGTIHFTNTPTTPRYQLFKKSKTRKRIAAVNTGRYDHLIKEISNQYRINPALVKAVIKAESNFDPYAVSKKGARGLMQLMPDTMKDLQVYNPFHPRENINGGVKFLKQLLERFNNDLPLSLAAYNAGPNAVEQYATIPPYEETQHYVKKVLNYFDRYRQEL
jgi:soluble lytic murein transglycosylase